jgi:hypothetical protein
VLALALEKLQRGADLALDAARLDAAHQRHLEVPTAQPRPMGARSLARDLALRFFHTTKRRTTNQGIQSLFVVRRFVV